MFRTYFSILSVIPRTELQNILLKKVDGGCDGDWDGYNDDDKKQQHQQ